MKGLIVNIIYGNNFVRGKKCAVKDFILRSFSHIKNACIQRILVNFFLSQDLLKYCFIKSLDVYFAIRHNFLQLTSSHPSCIDAKESVCLLL